MIAAFFLIALLQIKVPDAAQIVGPPQGSPLTGAQLERKTMELSSQLRCPVCQGLAIGDSPSIMAANMKAQVRELLERGYSDEQILSYFEKSYGQFVLLKPKFQGVNALVWLLPVIVLAIGFVLVISKAKKLETAPPAAVETAPPAVADEDPYLKRVREMVEKS
ncbi:MAG: cytochrome c-type biosis protein CcmH [Thermoanaerobaculia bacterium]|jgi:cytochrome c-type biogenesis protein CcmH|nr:cytochrome c-type biosis protein CcmH [Thermoanaerobaculia bacterium]